MSPSATHGDPDAWEDGELREPKDRDRARRSTDRGGHAGHGGRSAFDERSAYGAYPPGSQRNYATDSSAAKAQADRDAIELAHTQARRKAESGDLSGARTLLEDAVAAGELTLGFDHPRLAPLMVDLATIARSVGNLTEAQSQLLRAYDIVTATGGDEHPTALSIEGRLALVSHRLGDPTEKYDRHLVDAGARVLGGAHPAVRGAKQRLGITTPSASTPAQPAATQAAQAAAAPASPPATKRTPPTSQPWAPDSAPTPRAAPAAQAQTGQGGWAPPPDPAAAGERPGYDSGWQSADDAYEHGEAPMYSPSPRSPGVYELTTAEGAYATRPHTPAYPPSAGSYGTATSPPTAAASYGAASYGGASYGTPTPAPPQIPPHSPIRPMSPAPPMPPPVPPRLTSTGPASPYAPPRQPAAPPQRPQQPPHPPNAPLARGGGPSSYAAASYPVEMYQPPSRVRDEPDYDDDEDIDDDSAPRRARTRANSNRASSDRASSDRAGSDRANAGASGRDGKNRGNGGGVALIGSLGAAGLIAAVVIGFQVYRAADDGTHPISGRSQSSQTAPIIQASPPTGVTIKDNGGSVTLSWTDPSNGRVPFIVAGGRNDAPSSPLESVPPGRTTSTIYGLNDKVDYCFTVAAVWSAEVVATSSRTCTNRSSTSRSP